MKAKGIKWLRTSRNKEYMELQRNISTSMQWWFSTIGVDSVCVCLFWGVSERERLNELIWGYIVRESERMPIYIYIYTKLAPVTWTDSRMNGNIVYLKVTNLVIRSANEYIQLIINNKAGYGMWRPLTRSFLCWWSNWIDPLVVFSISLFS